MSITPESKEQIRASKEKQKAVIIECDKAILDIQSNIGVLQEALVTRNAVKKQAQDTLDSLDQDFPDITDTTDETTEVK